VHYIGATVIDTTHPKIYLGEKYWSKYKFRGGLTYGNLLAWCESIHQHTWLL